MGRENLFETKNALSEDSQVYDDDSPTSSATSSATSSPTALFPQKEYSSKKEYRVNIIHLKVCAVMTQLDYFSRYFYLVIIGHVLAYLLVGMVVLPVTDKELEKQYMIEPRYYENMIWRLRNL